MEEPIKRAPKNPFYRYTALFELSAGKVVVEWPNTLDPNDVDDMIALLELVKRRIQRKELE